MNSSSEPSTPSTDQPNTVDQEHDQQPESNNNSGWGWGGGWLSSTIGNVVRVMNQQTNEFGQKLQQLVAEEDEDVSTPSTEPSTTHPASSETPNDQADEENGQINDNGGAANASSLIEETEKTIETSLKTAEQKLKSLFTSFYNETSQLVDETAELKYVKGWASSFGKTVLHTLEEASRILYDNEENDDGIHIYVNFKELFIEYQGLKYLQEVASLSKQCNEELAKYMENRTDEQRDRIEKLLRELKDILIDSTQFSTKEVEEKKASYQYIALLPVGKEILETTNACVELAKNAYSNLEDVLGSTIEIEETVQTSTLLLEKSKAECYRSLAKLASLASLHILTLSQYLIDVNNGGKLPEQWQSTELSVTKDAKQVAIILRDYLLFLYSQLIEISNQYTEALKKNTSIVGIKLDEQRKESLEKRAVNMAARLHIHSDKALSIIISCDKEFLTILQYLGVIWTE
ncbi:hypothetical protein C9374_005427 [Naegleria lovaniensis]|uniref:Uncharacterized protein n=1 Tax=Naegleria lovaniensis TaxID=51637 RepID=A0AA88GL52_NAELO|nr:uncharacterized protein C9374_005427 [Naegleria lovaniensis]KAG2382225.1 hypothetical protein C9374_005427 [Naegleria lovaniensis]